MRLGGGLSGAMMQVDGGLAIWSICADHSAQCPHPPVLTAHGCSAGHSPTCHTCTTLPRAFQTSALPMAPTHHVPLGQLGSGGGGGGGGLGAHCHSRPGRHAIARVMVGNIPVSPWPSEAFRKPHETACPCWLDRCCTNVLTVTCCLEEPAIAASPHLPGCTCRTQLCCSPFRETQAVHEKRISKVRSDLEAPATSRWCHRWKKVPWMASAHAELTGAQHMASASHALTSTSTDSSGSWCAARWCCLYLARGLWAPSRSIPAEISLAWTFCTSGIHARGPPDVPDGPMLTLLQQLLTCGPPWWGQRACWRCACKWPAFFPALELLIEKISSARAQRPGSCTS